MNNTGIILSLAYPDTIVAISDEWVVPYLRFIGIGKKDYIRAGHAALVLIEKETGNLDYFDFGRYTTPNGFGRVRRKDTDCELDFPIHAEIENGTVKNLDSILEFLATHPKLTHGEGKLVASVCDQIDYLKAKNYLLNVQQQDFIRYGAFSKNSTNCSRFVTDALIASVTSEKMKRRLINSKWFTPSTVGNTVISNTNPYVFEVSQDGIISKFNSSPNAENLRCFPDKLKDHQPNLLGNLKPKQVSITHNKAQWLEGIGAGAWFELHNTPISSQYRFRRISPFGNVDCDKLFEINDTSFLYDVHYEFVHYSNCKFFHIKQNDKIFRFDCLIS